MKKRWMWILLLGASLAGAGTLLADDDDDDDDEAEVWGGEGRSGRAGGADVRAIPAPVNAAFKTECAACHMLYPPGLLPARSWEKLMAGLDRHFGENASLEPKVRDEIAAFLVANAADRGAGLRGARIAASIAPGDAPVRFSETYYFIRKHHEIGAAVFKRPSIGSPAKCNACHAGAEQGDFNEERVKIPR